MKSSPPLSTTFDKQITSAQKIINKMSEFGFDDNLTPGKLNFQKFNKWLGLPLDKHGYEKELLPFHLKIRDDIKKHKHVIINKFTGAAMTEVISRIMLEMAIQDKPYLKQFAFVTGIRMALTTQIMVK